MWTGSWACWQSRSSRSRCICGGGPSSRTRTTSWCLRQPSMAARRACHRQCKGRPGRRTPLRGPDRAARGPAGGAEIVSKSIYPPETPDVDQDGCGAAGQGGRVSLNQWIATAVAQKVGAVETAAAFFKRRAAGHSLDALDGILPQLPARPPEPWYELPEGWARGSLDAR